MKWLSRSGVIWTLSFFALVPAVAAHAVDDLVTAPEQRVFLGFPHEIAYLQEEGLLLMCNGGGVYAFDIASGTERWRRLLPATVDPLHWTAHGVCLGQRQVLFWSDPELILLDMKTGGETWRQRDTQFGDMRSAQLSPDESQVLVDCKKQYILFSVAGRTQRVLPKPDNALGAHWLPGSNALVFSSREEKPVGGVHKWLLMDIGTGEIGPAWERTISPDAPGPTFSSMGQCAEAIAEGKDDTTLRISDARTGTLLREFKGMPGRTGRFYWLGDSKRLLYRTNNEKRVQLVDTETGLVQCALSREGHSFTSHRPFEDASGNAWIFSTDAARVLFVWPLAPDGSPRKVLDGALLGPPGAFQIHVGDPCYALFTDMAEDRVETKTAYTLDGLRKIAEWHFPSQDRDGYQPMINRAMTHFIRTRQVGTSYQDRPQNTAFSVYIQDKTTPVCKGWGKPLAVSPDGRFLAVQSDDKTTCLYDVQTDKVVCQYGAVRDDILLPPRMHAAFSGNDTRFVLNTTESIEVTDLTGGYARWPMDTGGEIRTATSQPCLSPDGSCVLCGGMGCAWLFDADTGALLRSFEGPERVTLSGFPDTGIAHRSVEAAFAEGGTRIITHIEGRIIHVWDAGSGELLHTIHTELLERRNPRAGIWNRVVLSANGRFAFCHDNSKSGPASLWSLIDGTLQHRYQLPESLMTEAVPGDDGTAVYVNSYGNLYRWPGRPKELLDQPPGRGK